MMLSMKDSTRIQMAGSASISNRLLEQAVDARIIPALVLLRRIGISSERDHRPQEIEQMAIEDPAGVMKVNLGEHREACPLHSLCCEDTPSLDSEPHSIRSLDRLQRVEDSRQIKLTVLNAKAL